MNGDINWLESAGKVALVNNFDTLEDVPNRQSGIVDFLGYGTTGQLRRDYKSGATSNTTSLFRKNDGARTALTISTTSSWGANPRRTAPIVEMLDLRFLVRSA